MEKIMEGWPGAAPERAEALDALMGALVGLARSTDGDVDVNAGTHRILLEGLAMTGDEGTAPETIREMAKAVRREKYRLVPGCAVCAYPCGRHEDYEMADLWEAKEDIRDSKCRLLFGTRALAADALELKNRGVEDEELNNFFMEALFFLGEFLSAEGVEPYLARIEPAAQRIRELLK